VSILLAAGLIALVKTLVVTAIAALNAVLALVASIAVWKTYLALGVKALMIAVIFIPVVGVVFWLLWGQYKVRDARR
jgi:hypothetical protein